jgi:iron complex transport system permease protein
VNGVARSRASAIRLMLLLALAVLVVLFFSLGFGAVRMPAGDVLAGLVGVSGTQHAIVWDLRLARALLGVAIGAGLAGAGAAYQAVFRNPLADPFVIGASGGASLGATIAIILGSRWVMPAAFAGSLLAVALVYALAQGGGRPSPVNLLLAGAALSTLLTSAVSLLMFLSDRNLHEVFSWMMGGLGGRSWPHLLATGPAVLLGLGVLWVLNRPLDALALGEESAQGLGMNLPRTRTLVVGAATLATAAAVASGGVIGFVGLLAPHAARRLVGGSHALVIPTSALLGGLLLLLADDVARTLVAPVELPVGVLMSLVGAPFFLWLLRKA